MHDQYIKKVLYLHTNNDQLEILIENILIATKPYDLQKLSY